MSRPLRVVRADPFVCSIELTGPRAQQIDWLVRTLLQLSRRRFNKVVSLASDLAELAGLPPSLSAEELGFCYLIQVGNTGPIKIGWSGKPDERLKSLQTISGHAPMRILATFMGGHRLEKELHERFAYARISGEWFDPVPELLALASQERRQLGLLEGQ